MMEMIGVTKNSQKQTRRRENQQGEISCGNERNLHGKWSIDE